jgi:hypothetical protein
VGVVRGTALLAAALTLGACALPQWESFSAPDPATLFRPLSVTGGREKALPPVKAEELVDLDGRCAGSLASVEPPAGSASGLTSEHGIAPSTAQGGMASVPVAIALDMSECEVARRVGTPEHVQIGANEYNERTAVLTYLQGARPGIYRFTAGRLTAMERLAEPPAPTVRRSQSGPRIR